MDQERIGELRAWADSLARSEASAELRAAGRAIRLLADEVERLRREVAEPARAAAAPDEDDDDDELPPPPQRVHAERRRVRRLLLLGSLVAALAALVFWVGALVAAPSLQAHATAPGARFGAGAARSLAFWIAGGPRTLAAARWSLDGSDVTAQVRRRAGRATLQAGGLPDGAHRLQVAVDGGFPGARTRRVWRFAIDRSGPAVTARRTLEAHAGRPAVLAGRVERGAALVVDGRAVPVTDGRFSLRIPPPVPRSLALVATDRFGNATTLRVHVELVPREPPLPVRAVHVTFYAWADRHLRAGVLRLVDEHRVDALELDLKDESGVIGWNADVPIARRIGAVQSIYDLRATIRLLHRKGVRVIGRLVCFRDPLLAAAAWRAGDREQVIQAPGGAPYSGYGGFTNFADPVVRRYNIDVAVAAARAGIDEILYDYVRRPDGPLSSMVFPALEGTPEQSIVSFLRETRAALKPFPRVFLGASVFGVAATRPLEVAQHIPAMAREVDYIAPMVYPSHWARGEYDVADPNRQPYEIVRRSLADFRRDARGSGARIVPWLQDFSLGVEYGPAEVAAQIRAARAVGVEEWILWDPAVTYTAAALGTDARRRPVERRPPPLVTVRGRSRGALATRDNVPRARGEASAWGAISLPRGGARQPGRRSGSHVQRD